MQPDNTRPTGLDVGGAKIAGGLVSSDSDHVFSKREAPTRPERGSRAGLDDLLRIAQSLLWPLPL